MHGTDEEGPIAILIQLYQMCNLKQATTIHSGCFDCRGFQTLKQMVKGSIHVSKKTS